MKIRHVAALAALVATPAAAHVSLEQATVPAGTYQVLRFTVGHGCAGKDTTAVTIHVPPGVAAPHPQPKPGWTLTIERAEGGGVTAITWRGLLPNEQFDEFLVHAHLPAQPGPLAFPATQVCGADRVDWAGPVGTPAPAPVLTLLPGAPENQHHPAH